VGASVVTRMDPPPVLELPEHVLDLVALFVEYAVDLGLLHSIKQRVRRAAGLGRYQGHRRPARGMLALVIQNQPHRSGAHFGLKLMGLT
jgi:hypothetical protein